MIRIDRLVKSYGGTLAVHGLSLDVAPGEILGLVMFLCLIAYTLWDSMRAKEE